LNFTTGCRVPNAVRPQQANAVAPTAPPVSARKRLRLILFCSLISLLASVNFHHDF
jgi:hypothetical protein